VISEIPRFHSLLWVTALLAQASGTAATLTQDFDSAPSDWNQRLDTSGGTPNPSSIGFSNTNLANGTSGAGEASGNINYNDTFEYYADDTNVSLGGSDPFSSSGRLHVTISGTPSIPETFIGYFDTAAAGPRSDGFGFSVKDEDTDTWRIRPEARDGNTQLDTAGQITIEIASGSIVDWFFSYDPDANGGLGAADYTWTLVSGTIENDGSGGSSSTPGFDITTEMTLSANPTTDYDAFGLGVRVEDDDTQTAEGGTISFDDVTYTIPEPSVALLAGLGLLGLLKRRR